MSCGRSPVYEPGPTIEEAERALWRRWKPPRKGASWARLDSHSPRQPGLSRGQPLRTARAQLRKVAPEPDGDGRPLPSGDLNLRPDWRIACGNCGNSCPEGSRGTFAGLQRRPTLRPPRSNWRVITENAENPFWTACTASKNHPSETLDGLNR